MGIMVGALTLGSALPHLIAALGIGANANSVIVASSVCAVVSALILALLPEGPFPFARTRFDPRQISGVLRNRAVMLANLGYFGHMWELYAMWGWILAYAAASPAWGWNGSILAFAVIAMGAPGCVIAGVAAEKFGRCATTSAAMMVSGICAILLGLSFDGATWVLVAIALLWGLTVVADSAQFSAAVSELSDQTQVGSALAFQMGVGFAITMVTIWLVPTIAEMAGSWRWSFLILAPGPLIGTWAMLRLRRLPEAARIANGRR